MNALRHLAMLSGQVAVLALLSGVLIQVLRVWLTPRARCWIWGLVVLRLCLPVSLDTRFSLFNWLRPAMGPTASVAVPDPVVPASVFAPLPLPPSGLAGGLPVTQSTVARPIAADVSGDLPDAARTSGPAGVTTSASRIPWFWMALGIWLAGVLVLLTRTVGLALRMRRIVASGVPSRSSMLNAALDQARQLTGVRVPIRMVVVPGIHSPALYGFLRPTLLVPPGLEQILEPAQLRHVLLHECAHVRRRDIALNWLMAVLQAVHWFNPAVWLAFARLRAERELACDEIALDASGKDESEAYGRTLLHLLNSWSHGAPMPMPGAIGLLERHSDLRRRLRHIADFRPGRRLGVPVALLIAVAGAVTLTDAQSPSPKSTNAAGVQVISTQLPPVVPLRYTNAFAVPENRDLQSGGNWAKAPRGSNVLGGVHFEVDGLLQLASQSSVGQQRGFRELVTLPVRTNRYGSVHLLAMAAWSCEPNRRIAEVLWRYTDGTAKRSSILYTGHVRDWWRRPFEEPHRVFSKVAKCAVTWSSPDAAKNNAMLRAYRVSLANPEPSKPVAFLQLQSTMEKASLMVLGVSMDPLEVGQRPDPSPDQEPEDPKWTRHLGVTVIDAGTSNVVGGATVKATVSTSASSADREYTANGSGVADVLLPDEDVTGVTVEASAKEYSPTQHRFFFNSTNPVPAFVTVRLHGGATIGGVVLNQAGDPVEGVAVAVYRFWSGGDEVEKAGEDSGFRRQQTRTGPDGRWEASSIPRQRFNRIGVSFNHPDYVRASTHGILHDAGAQEALLEKRHEIRLEPALFVSGIVLNPEGQPVPNAEVRVGKPHYENTQEGKTDAQGRFRIGGQKPGETVIAANAKGWGGVSEKITLKTEMPAVTLTLKRGRTFSGIVTDADNQPLGDVWVAVESFDDLEEAFNGFNMRTAADGTWTWDSGPDGEVAFQFQKSGFSGKSRVRVKPDQPVTVVMNKPREVEGIVLDADSGEPVREFRLEPRGHWWTSSDARSFQTANGRFTISLSQDNYDKFHVTSPTHDPVDEPIPAAVRGVVQMTVRMKPGADWSGVVVDAAGKPVAGVTVALTGIDQQVMLRGDQLEAYTEGAVVVTGLDGSFKLLPAQNPVGVAAASADGFGYVSVEEFQQTHRIRLQAYGVVEGTYRGRVDEDGMARMTIEMVFGANSRWSGVAGTWDWQRNPTPSGSRFRFAQVPAGRQQLTRLVASGNGWEHRRIRDIVVEPGQTTTIDIGIEGSRVVGRIAKGEAANIPQIQWQVSLATASRWKLSPTLSREELQKLLQDPEFQRAMQQLQRYPCQVQPDGSFEAQGLPNGSYDLTVVGALVEDGKALHNQAWTATHTFTVPEGSAPDSVMDLGAIPVTPVPVPGK